MREAYDPMSIELRLPPLRGLVKVAFVLLALLAVSAVLASPICDALGVPGEVHQDDCCASLNDGLPVPPVAATSAFEPSVSAALPLPRWREWRAVASPAVAIPPDHPPLTRPYYARSARILI